MNREELKHRIKILHMREIMFLPTFGITYPSGFKFAIGAAWLGWRAYIGFERMMPE